MSDKKHRRLNLQPKVVISAGYRDFEMWVRRPRSSPTYGIYNKVADLSAYVPAGMRRPVAIREQLSHVLQLRPYISGLDAGIINPSH